ncbi:MAG: sulfatase-like hydrolase/transferase, partial [Candidatus Hydrogenedentota bacterium]
MMRSNILNVLSIVSVLSIGSAFAESRPNIVLIMADDMGYSDISPYGGEINTPNLDRLAKGGLRFTQFYNNAKCSPTRASLLTGLYSQQTGITNGPKVMKNSVTIAEVLRGSGYSTMMVGKWHALELPVDRGFDRYYGLTDGCCNFFNPGVKRDHEAQPAEKNFPRKWADDAKTFQPFTPEDPEFYTTDAFTDHALTYLDELGSGDDPFFLYVAYTAPHYPLQAPAED